MATNPIDNNYIDVNKASWNQATPHHVASAFYNDAAFRKSVNSLNDIEIELLGDVSGKLILHLQCHFGQDTISLARLGGKVTGVDFSDVAIAQANRLKADLNIDAEFICADVYRLPEHLTNAFDIVYTSYGVLGWLPDMTRWARAVASCLKPGGKLVLVEFHPFVWMYDNDFTHLQYSYFNREPIVEVEQGTYAARDAAIENKTVTWNHALSDVIGGLIENGLVINRFSEYDYAPYNCLKNMREVSPRHFQITGFENKLPLVYSVVATKM